MFCIGSVTAEVTCVWFALLSLRLVHVKHLNITERHPFHPYLPAPHALLWEKGRPQCMLTFLLKAAHTRSLHARKGAAVNRLLQTFLPSLTLHGARD